MKKELKLALVIFCFSLSIQFSVAQNKECKFHTLKECNNDTLKFLEKNFGYDPNYQGDLGNNGPRYIYQPLQLLFDEARKEGVTFHTFSWASSTDGTIYFVIYLQKIDQVREKILRGENDKRWVGVGVGVGVLGEENRKDIAKLKEHKVYPIDKKFMKWVTLARISQMAQGREWYILPEE